MLRAVFGAWDEPPAAYREVFTANAPALLAEIRGEERTDSSRFDELRVPTLVGTAEESPEPIQHGSEALARALPQARSVHVRGGHAIDPAGADVLAFVSERVASRERSVSP